MKIRICHICQKSEGMYIVSLGGQSGRVITTVDDGTYERMCWGCARDWKPESPKLAEKYPEISPRRREAIEHTRRKLGLL